ncbi:hypothetical protein BaRGS_00034935, partial [Batillaria attramentaria]
GQIRPIGLAIDRVDGSDGTHYRVEYDDRHNIVVVISRDDCYIVEAPDASWDPLVRDRSSLHDAAVAIVKEIESGTGVTSMTHREATEAYHSTMESFSCQNKDVHKVAYTPSS